MEKSPSRRRIISAFLGIVVGVAIYAFIIAPLLSDAPYLEEARHQAVHIFLPWLLVCAVACAIGLGVQGVMGRGK